MQCADEVAVLERARRCDQVALGEIYDRYAPRIGSYIMGHVGDQAIAEDLTATVFIKMLEALRASRGWQTSFSGWLYRIAHNVVVDHYRRNDEGHEFQLDERIVSAVDDPAAAVEQILATESIGAAMAQLTEEQQTVIALKFVEGLSNVEVAVAMGKTEGAIKSLQFRALAALRRCMEGNPKEKDGHTARDRTG